MRKVHRQLQKTHFLVSLVMIKSTKDKFSIKSLYSIWINLNQNLAIHSDLISLRKLHTKHTIFKHNKQIHDHGEQPLIRSILIRKKQTNIQNKSIQKKN